MSRGLGKMQREVLEHLRQAGTWQYAGDISAALHTASGATEDEWIPYQLHSSVCRAIGALERRHMVMSGNHFDKKYRKRDDPYCKLVVWLPGQAPPQITPNVPGAMVEQMVLDCLAGVSDEDRREFNDIYGRRLQVTADEVPYDYVLERVSRKPALYHVYDRGYMAINRAVTRMGKRGQLTVRRDSAGRIGAVKVSEKS